MATLSWTDWTHVLWQLFSLAVFCQANIKESQFGVDFFRQFSLVLNGLDNLDARRHVNRLCLAAKVPLIESGTAGYLGQVIIRAAQVQCILSNTHKLCGSDEVMKYHAGCALSHNS